MQFIHAAIWVLTMGLAPAWVLAQSNTIDPSPLNQQAPVTINLPAGAIIQSDETMKQRWASHYGVGLPEKAIVAYIPGTHPDSPERVLFYYNDNPTVPYFDSNDWIDSQKLYRDQPLPRPQASIGTTQQFAATSEGLKKTDQPHTIYLGIQWGDREQGNRAEFTAAFVHHRENWEMGDDYESRRGALEVAFIPVKRPSGFSVDVYGRMLFNGALKNQRVPTASETSHKTSSYRLPDLNPPPLKTPPLLGEFTFGIIPPHSNSNPLGEIPPSEDLPIYSDTGNLFQDGGGTVSISNGSNAPENFSPLYLPAVLTGTQATYAPPSGVINGSLGTCYAFLPPGANSTEALPLRPQLYALNTTEVRGPGLTFLVTAQSPKQFGLTLEGACLRNLQGNQIQEVNTEDGPRSVLVGAHSNIIHASAWKKFNLDSRYALTLALEALHLSHGPNTGDFNNIYGVDLEELDASTLNKLYLGLRLNFAFQIGPEAHSK